MLENTKQKVLLNAEAFLKFVLASFQMQNMLFSKFFNEKTSTYLHPVNRPLLTFSSFAYKLFLHLSSADIRMVKGPIEYNSSKGEIEFASFLKYVSNRNVEYGWSSNGQSKAFLPISVPDIYDKEKNTLYYFNGCYIHGHYSDCKFKKKQKSQDLSSKQRNMLFYKKMEKLSVHPKVEKIKIIWQCSWVDEKRNNPAVKQFLQHIYTNPPTYRLDARVAGCYNLYILYGHYIQIYASFFKFGEALMSVTNLYGKLSCSQTKSFIFLTKMDSMPLLQ